MGENPSAFPHDGIDSDNEFSWPSTGMTLRDYFAAKALPRCIAFDRNRGYVDTPEEAARMAYQFADAMLAAREAASKWEVERG